MVRRKDTDSERDDSEPDSGDSGDLDARIDSDDRVEVEITADHIYLPLDAEGNVPANWAEAADTVRVGKGTKLSVPADMLEMLADRVARVA